MTRPGGPTAREQLRSDYLAELAALLWPGGSARLVSARSTAAGRTAYLVVPSRRRPRLLVPVGRPKAAARAVAAAGGGRDRRTRVARAVLAAALRLRLDVLFPDRIELVAGLGPDAALDARLRQLTDADATVVVLVPAAKANRKPVLAVLDRAGRVLAYAKVSAGGPTAALVAGEADTLVTIGGLEIPDVRTPALLHAGRWAGRELLLQSALPVPAGPSAADPARLAAAMAATAAALGTHRAALAGSAYRRDLAARIAALPPGPAARELAAVLDTVLRVYGGAELTFGLWHGDWSPWNMAATPSTLLVWDWERMERDVPVGFDALHHHWQRGLGTPRQAVADLIASPGVVTALGVAPERARCVTTLYLCHFAARYLADGQAEAGSRLGPVTDWLLPELSASLTAPGH
jgi:hypothetical protein